MISIHKDFYIILQLVEQCNLQWQPGSNAAKTEKEQLDA